MCKYKYVSIVAATIIGLGLGYAGSKYCCCQCKGTPSATQTSYQKVVSQLDTNGHALVFVDPSCFNKFGQVVSEFFTDLIDLAKKENKIQAKEIQDTEMVIKILSGLWQDSGFYTVNGIGYSLIQPTNDSKITKSIITRKDSGNSYFLDLFSKNTVSTVLEGIPQDASCVVAGSFDINELVKIIEQYIQKNPQIAAQYKTACQEIDNQLTPAVKTTSQEILNALGSSYALAIKINEQNRLPAIIQMVAGGDIISMPEFKLCIETKNDLLFKIVGQLFTTNLKDVTTIQENTITINTTGFGYDAIVINQNQNLLTIASKNFSQSITKSSSFLARQDLQEQLKQYPFATAQGIAYSNEEATIWFNKLKLYFQQMQANQQKTNEDPMLKLFLQKLNQAAIKLQDANTLAITQITKDKIFNVTKTWGTLDFNKIKIEFKPATSPTVLPKNDTEIEDLEEGFTK